jgi:uncharacterized protein YjbI with pentapeptide repeats
LGPQIKQLKKVGQGVVNGRDTNDHKPSLSSYFSSLAFRERIRGTNLISANLSGADLSGAILTDGILVNAHLSGANLSRADLKGTVLLKVPVLAPVANSSAVSFFSSLKTTLMP